MTSTATPSAEDWAIRLEKEKQMTVQLSAKNQAMGVQQQFVVEKAADFALQQQQRIAELETQLGASAPGIEGDAVDTRSKPINVRHGCPRCSTCNTLLQTVGQLETMLQNRDSDCDMLRKALDDSQRVNALLLEQIDLLQRGLEKALINRHIPQSFQGQAPQLPLHHSVSPQRAPAEQQQQPPTVYQNQSSSAAPSPSIKHPYAEQQFNASALPVSMRMLQPSSEPTLRAMADAVTSLQNLWLTSGIGSAPSKPPSVPHNKLAPSEPNDSDL